jgi:hypothetical protein
MQDAKVFENRRSLIFQKLAGGASVIPIRFMLKANRYETSPFRELSA